MAWRDPAHYRLVQVCMWRPGQVNSTEISHPLKIVFKGTFEFPGVTPLLDFVHYTCCVCYLLSFFVINCSTSLVEDFYLGLSFCVYKVTQRITTGVISLEASVSPTERASQPVGTHWLICLGGCRDAHLLSGQCFFIFIQFSLQNGQIIR